MATGPAQERRTVGGGESGLWCWQPEVSAPTASDDDGEVSAQSGSSDSNETLTERVARWIRPLKNGTEVRGPRGVDTSRAMHFTNLGKNNSVDANETSEYEDYGEGRAGAYFDYVDYEPRGATSGTYAIAVTLIFLEQIALNGGSITVISILTRTVRHVLKTI